MYNKLLQRQIKKVFGDGILPEKLSALLNTISASYDHYEQDRVMLERSIDISSAEMINLNQSQKKVHNELKALFDNIEEVFFTIDITANKVLLVSPACEQIYGFKPEQFYENAKLWYEVILEEDKRIIRRNYSLLHAGKRFKQEYRIHHSDGSIRWIETKITPTLDSKKKVVKIDGVCADITKRKNDELAIAESENKFRHLFEKMVDGVYKSSHDGKFIDVNPALVNMLGYDSKEELLAIDIKTQLYFASEDRDEAVLQDKTEGTSVFRLRKKDGSEIWVEDRGQYVSDENGNVLYHEGILRDVTQRINAERQILESEEKFRTIIQSSYDLIQSVNPEGKFEFVNDSWLKTLGYNKEDLLTMTIFDVISPEHLSDCMNIFKKVINGEPVDNIKTVFITKTGKQIILEGNAVPRFKYNKVIGTQTFFRDVTEREKADEALRINFAELKKTNSELDKFVYSVSHDLRAPLCSMLGVVAVAQDDTTDELMLEHLNMLNGNIRKLDGFILDILNYSRNSRVDVRKEKIDIKELLTDVTQNLKFMGANNRKVDINIEVSGNTFIHSDKSRLSIIFNNLVSNAIRYQNTQVPDPFVGIKIDTSDTETGIIIRDNGIGIRPELHQKIFDMFYRVAEESIGSGLGLYIVKEAVTKLNGEIEVQSELGHGSTFIIRIPNN